MWATRPWHRWMRLLSTPLIIVARMVVLGVVLGLVTGHLVASFMAAGVGTALDLTRRAVMHGSRPEGQWRAKLGQPFYCGPGDTEWRTKEDCLLAYVRESYANDEIDRDELARQAEQALREGKVTDENGRHIHHAGFEMEKRLS